ncbi:MAG: four helix bundle protein [Planctomycetes bacterium]|nr:four helix bundle protein [Planctomycetota bacterium]
MEARTFEFAIRVLRLVKCLQNDTVGNVVARQLARSGTSVGANVEEAQGSHSRAEFVRRMGIARSEAREAHYWLRIIGEVGLVKPSRLVKIIKESEEILKILTAIVKNSRKV